MKTIGNTASNAKYCPDERANPPPTNAHSDERDSEMEKYIRRKYEQKSFMPGARGGQAAPTSLHRARDKMAQGASPWVGRDNKRNPELNDIVVPSPAEIKEKALPGLPASGSRRGSANTASLAPPRLRPSPTPSRSSSIQNLAATGGVVGPGSSGPQLIDLKGASSSTLPLQLASNGGNPFQANNMGMQSPPSQVGMSAFGTSPTPMYANGQAGTPQQALSPIHMPTGNSYFGQPQQSQQFGSFAQSPSSFPQQPAMLSIPSQPMQQFGSPGGAYTMQSMNPFAASSPGAMGYSPSGMQGAGGMIMGMGQAPMQMGMQNQYQNQAQTQGQQWGMQGMPMQGMNGGWQGQQYHG